MAHRLSRRVWLAGSALLAVEAVQLGLGAALGSGCGSTTGQRIRLETAVSSDLAVEPTVVAVGGWAVTVTRAELWLEDVYYLESAPVAARLDGHGPGDHGLDDRGLDDRGLDDRGLGAALVGRAYAHPGHYQEGAVLGEAHGPVRIDLLAGERSLGERDAVTGLARSATLGFAEGSEPAVLIEGVARLDGQSDRVFTASALADELLSTATELPEVAGCSLQGGDFSDDGVVEMTVGARLWIEQIDFSLLPDNGGVVQLLSPDEPPGQAFLRGVRKSAAYRFAYRRR